MTHLDNDHLIRSLRTPGTILDTSIAGEYRCIELGRGRLHCSSGGFCVAFKMQNNAGKAICFRVWKVFQAASLSRYKLIAEHLNKQRLPYFIKYRYIEQGLKVPEKNVIAPAIEMEWVEGSSLDKFLNEKWENLKEEERKSFTESFIKMCRDLHDCGISHGDLSCANIFVTPDRRIKLLDYDSLYVPAMGNRYAQSTGGAAGFQHPLRIQAANANETMTATFKDDNFSQLLIALALLVAVKKPDIVREYGDTSLLFKATDLSNDADGAKRKRILMDSSGWKTAATFRSFDTNIALLMDALAEGIASTQDKVKHISEVLQSKPQPQSYYVNYCTNCGYRFPNQSNFAYCPICGKSRHIYIK